MEAKETVRLCGATGSGFRINCDSRCHTKQAEISFKAGIREVVEGIAKDMNISIRYDHNATCYDCIERIKNKYISKLNSRKCTRCGWKGLESETGFGHNDFYCPICRVESLA